MAPDTTVKTIQHPRDLVQAALTHARNNGCREVRITEASIRMVDYWGNLVTVAPVEAPANIAIGDIRDAVHERKDGYYHLDSEWDVETSLKELGNWGVSSEGQDYLTLRPKKAPNPCLEALMDIDEEGLSRLRSLYASDGFDVIIMCEGEGRTREVATAMMVERRLLGLPTDLSLLPLSPRYNWARGAHERKDYAEWFLPDATTEGAPWHIRHVNPRDVNSIVSDDFDGPGTRVLVMAQSRYAMELRHLKARQEQRKRPFIGIQIRLESSKPVAQIAFPSRLLPRTSLETGFRDAPWDLWKARKETRLKSRPQAPKTWHQTTLAVAQHFVKREAPRGYVSNRSLYFHGPVAFSIYDGNPIAAIVDNPKGGKPFLFMGRDTGLGGTMAGTVTSAQGDITQAAGKDFHELHVGDLSHFVRLGDLPLKRVATKVRHAKNEADFPGTCCIDRDGISTWIGEQRDRFLADIEASGKTKFPTYNRAGLYGAVAGLAEFRDVISESFGMHLPAVADAKLYRKMAKEENAAANQRQVDLRQRKEAKATPAAPEPDDAASFGMR